MVNFLHQWKVPKKIRQNRLTHLYVAMVNHLGNSSSHQQKDEIEAGGSAYIFARGRALRMQQYTISTSRFNFWVIVIQINILYFKTIKDFEKL